MRILKNLSYLKIFNMDYVFEIISVLALALSIYNFITSAKIKGKKITNNKGDKYYEKL